MSIVLTPRQQEIMNALEKFDGDTKSTAEHLNTTPANVRAHLSYINKKNDSIITAPDIPSEEQPSEDIVERMKASFDRKMKRNKAKKWMPFTVHSNAPIGLQVFGDPHLDDNGCNWTALERDLDVCANTDGMYGMNIGDSHNNWVGFLVKKYIDQGCTRNEAYQLIRYFFYERGVNWLVILLGNHDEWNDGDLLLKEMNIHHRIVMESWRAQFRLVFPNKREAKIDAAHDHKGHSQWNALHAQAKVAMMGEHAHLIVAGHRHTYAEAKLLNEHTGQWSCLARARGYKFMDDYAFRLGFGEQNGGESVTAIFDPNASEAGFVNTFADSREAADFLTWKRNRFELGKGTE